MEKRYGYITPEDYEIAEQNGIAKTTVYQRVYTWIGILIELLQRYQRKTFI